MKKLFQKGVRRFKSTVYYRYHYRTVMVKHFFKRLFQEEVDNIYLFILSPPYCGSTLINELISTSSKVSTNNDKYTREGQRLPKVESVMFGADRWDDDTRYDWEFIKREWKKYWDVTKPILLEKSPPNIIRAEEIAKHFSPVYFLCFNRNPYAHCESLMRRSKNLARPEDAAEFAVRCLYYQQKNLKVLDNVLHISYEELSEFPEETTKKIEAFVPGLEQINPHQEFYAHNYKAKKMKITNLNDEKIRMLSQEELERINSVFVQHQLILNFFHYELLQTIPA